MRTGPSRIRHERSEKLSQTVARAIIDDAVRDGIVDGQMLASESALADKYGVGRSSLREAVRLLEGQGIVEVVPGATGGPLFRGADSRNFAETMSLFMYLRGATVGDLMTARLAIEPVAARAAAENDDPAAMERIREYVTEHLERSDSSDMRAFTYGVAALNFHELVCASSGNAVLEYTAKALVHILIGVEHQASTVGSRTYDTELRERNDDVHRRIAAAILAGDGDRAHRLTQSHVEHDVELMKQTARWLYDSKIQWHRRRSVLSDESSQF